MSDSKEYCWTPSFSHVYVERAAADDPMTQRILGQLPNAIVVSIDDYRDVFNRHRQNPVVQRHSPKLILAKRTGDFLYMGSDNCQNYGYGEFHYATPMLNCPFDCDYCYLQAAHASANVVIFVNIDDFLSATSTKIDQRADVTQPLYLSLAYDNDLLALESMTGICRRWIEFGRDRDDLILEIRTKSAAFAAIADMQPTDSIILSWTLSSDWVHDTYESRTPSTESRLAAAKRAIDHGWRVRLCFDPIIPGPNWRTDYADLISRTFAVIDPKTVTDITAGVFRMSPDHYEKIRRLRPDCGLFCSNAIDRALEPVTVREELKHDVMTFIVECLSSYVNMESIALWE